jgi:glycosyltransferase involved in cell wall biosynthesis
LEPQKRQELLIEAAQHLRSPLKVVLAGGSGDVKHYEELIKQNGVGDRVTMRGFVSDREMAQLYAGALAVCYLPFDEDYGYVTLEGMLAAKPVVVARDSGGAAEFIEPEHNGLIVEPDPRAVAEAIDRLHSDRAWALRLGLRARDKIKEMDLSWQKVVERLISAAS